MGAAAGRLADDGGPLQVLHVVGEFLGPGKRARAGQDVKVGVDRLGPGNVGQGPVVLGHIGLPVIEIVEVGRLTEEIGADELDLGRISPAVLAHVDDDGVAVGQEVQGGDSRLAGPIGRGEDAEIEIADVARQLLHLAETEIIPLGFQELALPDLAGLFLALAPDPAHVGRLLRVIGKAHVPVLGDIQDGPGHGLGERAGVVGLVEPAAAELGPQGFFDFLGGFREDVSPVEDLGNLVHDGPFFSHVQGRSSLRILTESQGTGQRGQEEQND